MYADDSWISDVNNPKMFRLPEGEAGLEDKHKIVDKWRGEKVPRSAHPSLRPYLKHALYLGQTPCENAMGGGALETLEEGTSPQSDE